MYFLLVILIHKVLPDMPEEEFNYLDDSEYYNPPLFVPNSTLYNETDPQRLYDIYLAHTSHDLKVNFSSEKFASNISTFLLVKELNEKIQGNGKNHQELNHEQRQGGVSRDVDYSTSMGGGEGKTIAFPSLKNSTVRSGKFGTQTFWNYCVFILLVISCRGVFNLQMFE